MERVGRIVSIGLVAAPLTFAGGCAMSVDQPRAALAPSVAPTPETVGLKGLWRGSFAQVGVGDTGQVQGDVDCKVGDDGTYTATWTTRVVAGSSRGSRVETSGAAVATGAGVAFAEQGGSRFTLKHVGDTLYGIRKDPVSGRTIAVRLERISPVE